ncbi:MAG: 30S ribosomal protein S2 [Patescibacteria group bacterium]
MTKIPTIEEMLKAGMHFGHRTSKWHPKMEPFIFTARRGVYIIDLVKTEKMLITALDFIKKLTSEGKVILFVGTKNQVKIPLKKIAEEVGMPYVTGKWLGGCLTNFLVVKKSIKKYQNLVKQRQDGKLDKYTKMERLEFDREIERLELKVGGLVNLTKLPDAIFVWDIKKENTTVVEARKKNIPLIAICDTNVNPTNINYVIPGNDDATKTIKLILNVIKEAILKAKEEKESKK